AKVFAAAGLLAAAAMIRPTGIFLPLFAPLPFLFIKGANWPRALVFGMLAFAISIAPMLAWTARNQRVAGVGTTDTDSAGILYYYDAAGVLSYATHRDFFTVRNELHRHADSRGDNSPSGSAKPGALVRESLEIFLQHPIATVLVMDSVFTGAPDASVRGRTGCCRPLPSPCGSISCDACRHRLVGKAST